MERGSLVVGGIERDRSYARMGLGFSAERKLMSGCVGGDGDGMMSGGGRREGRWGVAGAVEDIGVGVVRGRAWIRVRRFLFFPRGLAPGH